MSDGQTASSDQCGRSRSGEQLGSGVRGVSALIRFSSGAVEESVRKTKIGRGLRHLHRNSSSGVLSDLMAATALVLCSMYSCNLVSCQISLGVSAESFIPVMVNTYSIDGVEMPGAVCLTWPVYRLTKGIDFSLLPTGKCFRLTKQTPGDHSVTPPSRLLWKLFFP